MSWDILPKSNLQYFLQKLKAKFDGKVDTVTGKGLSTNDYTNEEKALVEKIPDKADTDDVKGIQTTTGNPITITDAAPINAESLVVELEPKQDLHGYDFPWVGGAGKNKLPLTLSNLNAINTEGTWNNNVYSLNNVTFTVNTDDGGNVTGIKVNSSGASARTLFYLYDSSLGSILQNQIVSISGLGGFNMFAWSDGNWYNSAYNSPIGFQLSNSGLLQIWAEIVQGQTSDFTVQPQIEIGNQATPFAPYSNICPISGYEGVEVDDVGKNLFDKSTATLDALEKEDGSGTTSFSGYYTSDYMLVEPSTDYYLQNVAKGADWYCAFFFDNSKTFLSKLSISSSGEVASGKVTTPSNCKYLIICGKTSYIDVAQVTKRETAPTEYHPYQSRTASVTFGQTVYGGSVDFTTGVLTVDMVYIEIPPTWSVNTLSNDYLLMTIGVDNAVQVTNQDTEVRVASDMFRPLSAKTLLQSPTPFSIGLISNSRLYASATKTMFPNLASFNAWVSENKPHVCYEIANKGVIQLTPQELKLLQDTNTLTTNGTTITLDYIPNNSIGDAVKASEEYTDRAVERVAPKAKLLGFYEIYDESGTLYDVTIPTATDANFILFEYRIQSRVGSTLIPSKSSYDNYISVEVNNGGNQNWVEFLYNSTYHTLTYASNVTTGFGVLSIYTI